MNVLAQAALSMDAKVAARALHFFLSNERDDERDEADEGNTDELASVTSRRTELERQQNAPKKKSRNRANRLERTVKLLQRREYASFPSSLLPPFASGCVRCVA